MRMGVLSRSRALLRSSELPTRLEVVGLKSAPGAYLENYLDCDV